MVTTRSSSHLKKTRFSSYFSCSNFERTKNLNHRGRRNQKREALLFVYGLSISLLVFKCWLKMDLLFFIVCRSLLRQVKTHLVAIRHQLRHYQTVLILRVLYSASALEDLPCHVWKIWNLLKVSLIIRISCQMVVTQLETMAS